MGEPGSSGPPEGDGTPSSHRGNERPPCSRGHCASDKRPHQLSAYRAPSSLRAAPRKEVSRLPQPQMALQPSVNRSVEGGGLSRTGPPRVTVPRIWRHTGHTDRADGASRPLTARHAGRSTGDSPIRWCYTAAQQLQRPTSLSDIKWRWNCRPLIKLETPAKDLIGQ